MKNYGYIEQQIQADEFELGGILGLTKKILVPDLNWLPYIPAGERQRKSVETSSCTQFGTLNQIETLQNFGKGAKNYSERALAIMSGNSPNGNNPHKVLEVARKKGIILEKQHPFTKDIKTWEEFMSPDPLPKDLLKKAALWPKKYKLGHEWLWRGNPPIAEKQKRILDALQYSPVGVSVQAWMKRGGVYYKNPGGMDNHWTLLVHGKPNATWAIYDSYIDDTFIKDLEWEYDFSRAKLITLEEIRFPVFNTNWIKDFFIRFKAGKI